MLDPAEYMIKCAKKLSKQKNFDKNSHRRSLVYAKSNTNFLACNSPTNRIIIKPEYSFIGKLPFDVFTSLVYSA